MAVVSNLTGVALIVLASAALVLSVAVLVLVVKRGLSRVSVDGFGVHATVEATKFAEAVEIVNRELTHNGGSSIKDAIARIEARLTELEEAVTKPGGKR